MAIGNLRVGSAAALALGALTVPLAAQAYAWRRVATDGPPSRSDAAMTFDSQRGRTVLHGGVIQQADFGDTWEWNGSRWYWVSVDGPSRRRSHAIEYDPLRQETVLFGGTGSLTGPTSDTWTWTPNQWTARNPAMRPSPRFGHAMAFDPLRGRVVLFGGGYLPHNDTWEWDGKQWTSPTWNGPAGRHNHAMAWDPVGARVLLFGGVVIQGGNRTLFGDTWSWDGTQWSQLPLSGPSPRERHRMVTDTQRGRIVLLGGGDNVTWEWDGSAWWSSVASGPEVSAGFSMAHDSLRGRTVLFGRSNASGGPETWEYGPAVVATAQPYGSGCGAPALQFTPDPQALPVIGGTARATVANVPAGTAFVALGTSDTEAAGMPLPLDLGPFGMPGCSLWQSADLALLWPTTPGAAATATFTMDVPDELWLVGMDVYAQAWAPAPGANAGGLVTSDAIAFRIGHL
jgi:hypothetical protein